MSFSEVINMINKHGHTSTMLYLYNEWESAENELDEKRKALQRAEIKMENAKASVRHFITSAAQNGLTRKTVDGHVLNVIADKEALITFFIGYDDDGPLKADKTEIQKFPD